MDKRNNNMDPWDPDYYGTGSTQPPKSYGALVAVLLMGVIVLCGLTSTLGLLGTNRQEAVDETQGKDEVLALHAQEDHGDDPHISSTQPKNNTLQPMADAELRLDIVESPISVDNVPQEGGKSLQDIYEANIPSVVSISCTLSSGSATGTGVVFSDAGYVVTNAHVVDEAKSIQVDLTDGRSLPAQLIGADGASDLAVLYVEAEDLTPATFGDSSVLRVGDSVVAIGDPLGKELRGTMTDGIVSAINRDISIDGRVMTLIQTNAALNSGNSGGPLINCYGQVVGINTMKIGDYMSSNVEGLGFAIPSTTVKTIVDQLIQQGYVSGRPRLGISVERMSGVYQRYYGLPGCLYITEVEEGSPAQAAGIQPGDVLVSFQSTYLPDADTLSNLLYGYDAGDQVSLVIFRNGRQYGLELTLGEANGN